MDGLYFQQSVDLAENEKYHSYCSEKKFSAKKWFKKFSKVEEKNLTSEQLNVLKKMQERREKIFSVLNPLVKKLKENQSQLLVKNHLKKLKKTIKQAKQHKTSLSRVLKAMSKSCENIQSQNNLLQQQLKLLKQMYQLEEMPSQPFMDFLNKTISLACEEIARRKEK